MDSTAFRNLYYFLLCIKEQNVDRNSNPRILKLEEMVAMLLSAAPCRRPLSLSEKIEF